ncbi:glycoside hydrolase family 88 protein [Halococcus agarilyticus]|uniref:glycoside hydrolase family 88 protein n=1 Tax=Halococcus agarilyticus TaxID=1232219 RepID=UPI000677F1A3|nr:glycoside hydrolase family 88 protein [Halococcus agarilyticus]
MSTSLTSGVTLETKMNTSDAIDVLGARVEGTLEQVDSRFPLYADSKTGTWETTADGNWCAGHWIGLLWLASAVTDATDTVTLQRAARAYTEQAGWDALQNSLFSGMNYRYAGYRAADITDEPSLSAFGQHGAEDSRALFDETASIIPVGSFGTRGLEHHVRVNTEGIAAVDAVYTAGGVLWRAARETGDERYRRLAERHAATHRRWFVRADGSVWHKVAYNTETGDVQKHYNQLTRAPDTCWSRGLGWSIAGLADAYNATGETEYLDTLERHITYYRQHTPPDDVPFAELGDAAPETYRDTSAAALTAYGLVRLADESPRAEALRKYGRTVRSSLVKRYLASEGSRRGQLREGCYNAVDDVAPQHELIWSTYYLLCSLTVDRHRELFGSR